MATLGISEGFENGYSSYPHMASFLYRENLKERKRMLLPMKRKWCPNSGHSFTLHVYVNTSHIILFFFYLFLTSSKHCKTVLNYLYSGRLFHDCPSTTKHASVFMFQNKSRFVSYFVVPVKNSFESF